MPTLNSNIVLAIGFILFFLGIVLSESRANDTRIKVLARKNRKFILPILLIVIGIAFIMLSVFLLIKEINWYSETIKTPSFDGVFVNYKHSKKIFKNLNKTIENGYII